MEEETPTWLQNVWSSPWSEKTGDLSHFSFLPLSVCAHAQSFSCVQLCNPMDCSPPGPSVHAIILARILECPYIGWWKSVKFLWWKNTGQKGLCWELPSCTWADISVGSANGPALFCGQWMIDTTYVSHLSSDRWQVDTCRCRTTLCFPFTLLIHSPPSPSWLGILCANISVLTSSTLEYLSQHLIFFFPFRFLANDSQKRNHIIHVLILTLESNLQETWF